MFFFLSILLSLTLRFVPVFSRAIDTVPQVQDGFSRALSPSRLASLDVQFAPWGSGDAGYFGSSPTIKAALNASDPYSALLNTTQKPLGDGLCAIDLELNSNAISDRAKGTDLVKAAQWLLTECYGDYQQGGIEHQAAKAKKAYQSATETISVQDCQDAVGLQREVKADDVVPPTWFLKPEQHQMLGHLALDWVKKISLESDARLEYHLNWPEKNLDSRRNGKGHFRRLEWLEEERAYAHQQVMTHTLNRSSWVEPGAGAHKKLRRDDLGTSFVPSINLHRATAARPSGKVEMLSGKP
ncbi:MAG: hypothetical protein Q9178_006449 [Gyalolechia marmorata]